MSIAILYLHYESGGTGVSNGWHVDIHGLIYSQRDTFRKQFPAATERSQEEQSQPQGTFLSAGPHEEPQFKFPVRDPPLQVVTAYLKQISEFGYQVVATDSTSDENGYRKTTLWTLQKTK